MKTKRGYDDLLLAKELVYDQYGFDLADLNPEAESAEYGACTFTLNGMSVTYRASKITPTKTGQFVTIWKRSPAGITEPFDVTDDIDLIIIAARSNGHFGQFIFPRSVLLEKGIISGNNKEGKRGIRVYPPWDTATNMQAERTQKWQAAWFLEIRKESLTDSARIKKLFSKAE